MFWCRKGVYSRADARRAVMAVVQKLRRPPYNLNAMHDIQRHEEYVTMLQNIEHAYLTEAQCRVRFPLAPRVMSTPESEVALYLKATGRVPNLQTRSLNAMTTRETSALNMHPAFHTMRTKKNEATFTPGNDGDPSEYDASPYAAEDDPEDGGAEFIPTNYRTPNPFLDEAPNPPDTYGLDGGVKSKRNRKKKRKTRRYRK
jgi:hypothetical protein